MLLTYDIIDIQNGEHTICSSINANGELIELSINQNSVFLIRVNGVVEFASLTTYESAVMEYDDFFKVLDL